MKKALLYAALLGCAISGCKQPNKVSYSGVFRLEKQTISDGSRDTVCVRGQMKIYTDHQYIYASLSSDSTVNFGVGSYSLDADSVIAEHNIFNNKALDSTQIFSVTIHKTDSGFTGVIPEWAHSKQAIYSRTENYTKLPLANSSALDGLWSLDKVYWVKGKDTSIQHEDQFKVFYKGYFMFVHRYPSNPVGTQFKNGFGYGKFTLNDNDLNENVEASSHQALAGNHFSIKITFDGNDKYTQVLNDPKTQVQTTEIYRRIN